MTSEELKQEPVFIQLKKDKAMQKAAEKLQALPEWGQIKRFVSDFQAVLAQEALDSDDFEVSKRYRHLIRGMQFIAFLPELVSDIKSLESQEAKGRVEKAKDALRRKFAPGSWRG